MLFCDYELIDDGGQPAVDAIWWHKSGPRSATIALPRGRSDLDALHVRMDNNFVGPCFLHRGVVAHALGAWCALMGVEDYDYWMRLDNAFRMEHLLARGERQRTTDRNGTAAASAAAAVGPLYRYRVHVRSLTSHQKQLAIESKLRALLEVERRRRLRRRLPWRLFCSPDVCDLLADALAHRPHPTHRAAAPAGWAEWEDYAGRVALEPLLPTPGSRTLRGRVRAFCAGLADRLLSVGDGPVASSAELGAVVLSPRYLAALLPDARAAACPLVLWHVDLPGGGGSAGGVGGLGGGAEYAVRLVLGIGNAASPGMQCVRRRRWLSLAHARSHAHSRSSAGARGSLQYRRIFAAPASAAGAHAHARRVRGAGHAARGTGLGGGGRDARPLAAHGGA